jgi:serine/threonine-protein kinase PknG
MQSSRGNLGAGLVEVPSISGRDPMSAVLSEPEVPERKRMCARCSEPVGRSHDGQPGRTEGYCTHCGSAFSFSPKLWPGDLVAGQYQVAGCIAHGGLGWIYLARDRNVSDRWVVLKGLLDSEDASAMAAAIAEQKFLAEVEHPNIVKIYNFVQHADAGYIVMEYVGGDSLREIRNRHREVHGAPLPVAQSIAYILEVLPAFGYLHRRGLLFCDFKPDNVIQTEEQLRLLDLGGVRAVDDQDSDLYGTVGYQAPEVPDQGASVPSDLYTVGRTLAVLSLDIPGFQDERRHAFQLPSADQVPAFRRYESFHQFMLKATAPDPAARFQSAADMADQLLGVLRQVIAVDGGEPPPARSSHFSGALGQGVLRSSWSDLPVPVVDPFDPAAGLVAAAAMAGPDQVLAMLETAPRTPESAFALARTLIEEGRTDEALDALESPEAGPGGWRNAWWRGVLHLAASRPADALSFLSVVAAELPGELAPRLALAVSYEQAADHSAGAEGGPGAGPAGVSHALDSAGRYFDLVAGTNPTFAGACFGLARVRSAQGDRAGGVAALQRIPGSSSSHLDAQVALVRLLTREVGGAAPSLADLTSASEVIARMAVEPSVRLPLVADLLLQALDMLLAGRVQPDPTVVLVSTPLDEHELRGALERTYRSLANLAPTDEERFELVDRANAWRPRTMT